MPPISIWRWDKISLRRGGYEKWAILGGFSRLNYSYKDRYLLELDGRYDGSSKFRPVSVMDLPLGFCRMEDFEGSVLARRSKGDQRSKDTRFLWDPG